MIYDLIIIGGGPAGMSAALYGSRHNLKFILIATKLGGLANLVPTLKTYLGSPYVTGFDLVQRFQDHLNNYKIRIVNQPVLAVGKNSHVFSVKTNKNTYRTRTVIIATGRRFKKLHVPGEELYFGKGLSDCTICDGPLFKGKTVAVVGGGRSGLYATIFLLNIAKKIYLIEKEDRIKTKGIVKKIADAVSTSKKVEILTNTVPVEIRGDRFVRSIVLQSRGKKKVLPVEGAFVEIGYDPVTDIVKGVARLNKLSEIIVNPECQTNVPGLFAAGDVTNVREKQVIVSAGEGAKAALSAILYLEETKGAKRRRSSRQKT